MAADIQREADRLRVRLREDPVFREPSRNPFRFAPPARVAPAPREAAPPITEEPMAPVTPEQPTLRITLSGIAEDKVGDQVVRTAIVSTPSDVLLVKEGELIGDQYKVVKIAADAIELVRLEDGSIVRLALKP
jgi:Tfp pilus assembly protein PilP